MSSVWSMSLVEGNRELHETMRQSTSRAEQTSQSVQTGHRQGMPCGRDLSAFVDHKWTSQWSSAVGIRAKTIDNTDGQAPNSFKGGPVCDRQPLYVPFRL
jgi:hypothetical protein